MTEHLTMNTVIHAAFRRDIARFDAALASFPDGSQARADQLVVAWDFFEEQLHDHHDFEEEYFWPALRQTDADLTSLAALDGEHQAMRDALDVASREVRALRTTPTSTQAGAARTAVAQFSTVLLDHLAHEERDLEPITAAYQDAPSMKAALKQVKRAHFSSMGNLVEWLRDGADASDVAGMHQQVPAPVAFAFAKVAGGRYRREIAPTWRVG
ncbi:hemerythrin domain-containing protein [Nocardioides dongkuii]|uniref:hemerythrin domain-containing protein n=1 Tax=Nocardioides dongkuii TaxID=2760089 RepID=UPI0015FE67D5|nr:hemerythrin domain-containing protein [Nocardioides dongkuii]